MPYSVQPVILQSAGAGMTQSGGTTGFPSTAFNYLLFSEWMCLGTQPRSVGVYNNVAFMQVACNNTSVQVRLLAGASNPVFDGTYIAPISNVLSNILVSADPVTQRIQVYHNDGPLTLSSGGWTGSGPFHITGLNSWNVTGSGSIAPGSGIADLFIAAPAAFYDLSVVANRRKFIHAALTPVDLGADASSVLGTAPPIYLTSRTGVANDFAANHGTGGAFTISASPLAFQAAGTCVLPTPPPGTTKLAMDNVVATAQATLLPKNLISLRWSDDRGHSYGSPVTQDIGEAGEYRTSLQWQRLAYARDRVFEISWSVPMRTALQGAWIDVTPAQS